MPLISNATDLHHTFMDTQGRTTLTLTALNIVDDIRDRELIVAYDYPFSAGLKKPVTMMAAVMAVFLVSWGISNLDNSIGRKR